MTNQTSKPSLGIPGTYWKNGAFYRVKDNRWVRLGATEQEARDAYQQLSQKAFAAGTVGHAIERFEREVIPGKSPRTQADYLDATTRLKNTFGHMRIRTVKPHHISDYLTQRGAPVRANREVAVLSSVMTHAMSWGMIDANPCFRVKRNTEKPRDRYIEDSEYTAVLGVSNDLVRDVMTLSYTLAQRISDVLKLRVDDVRGDAIYVKQNKTGARLLIRMSQTVAEVVARRLDSAETYLFEHDSPAGKVPYTYDGYAAMFKRTVKRALVRGLVTESFTIHDLRAKALTDADLAGRDAQKLAGHANRKQTEDYIKRRRTVAVDSLEAL